MKNLKKLELKHRSKAITVQEMKNLVGGNTYSQDCSKKSCSSNSDCGGGVCANFSSPGVNGCIGKYCL